METPLHIGRLSLGITTLGLLTGIIVPLVLIFASALLLLVLARRVVLKPLKVREGLKERLFRDVRLAVRVAAWIAAAYVVLRFVGTSTVDEYLRRVWVFLTTPFVAGGSSHVSIITLVLLIPVFFFANVLSRLAKRLIDSALHSRSTVSDAMRFTVSGLVRYGVLALGAVIGLSLAGIDISSLAVLFGVVGIGLGFGLQGLVANYVAGLTIILERPLKEGDRIMVDDVEGDVVRIKLRSTVINTLTNETIIVPNSKLIGNSIHNYSHEDRRIVTVNNVQVSYGADLERASEVLLEVASRNPFALRDPPPEVRVSAFQDSGIQLALWTWIGEATDRLRALSWTNLEIWRSFKSAGVEIPFPQVDLHVK